MWGLGEIMISFWDTVSNYQGPQCNGDPEKDHKFESLHAELVEGEFTVNDACEFCLKLRPRL